MEEKRGIVFDIKEMAVFDGPGVRTTVFLKGCPLRCQWCHNPEGLSPRPQLMTSPAACTHCGACERICPHPKECIACGQCVPACRAGLRRIAGACWTAEALAARLAKDEDVYRATGGGITFSGGEPLLQWPFIAAVLQWLPGMHTALETSGYASDAFFAQAMKACSLILMDWKVSDPALHRYYTGADQTPILRHLRQLAQGSTPFILRLPIIPGVNDNAAHFERAAALVSGAKALVRVEVLPYQRAAGAKYAMIGKVYSPEFPEDQPPRYFLEPFERLKIPYQVFQ